MRTSKSGSVLAATLVIAVAMTVVLAGLLSWVNTESNISRRNLLQVKAQYGAEAAVEYALAQVHCTLEQMPTISDTYFTPSGTPPTLADVNVLGPVASSVIPAVVSSGSSGYATNIAASLATLQSTATNASTRYQVTGATVRVGTIGAERSLNATDLANAIYEDDPLRDKKSVKVREVRILASATATDAQRGETHTAYCEETLQMRDTPLGRYAAFYNPVLEIAPGALMNMSGPVHCNRDIYVQSGAGLNFHGVVTTAGKIYHGRAPNSGQTVANGAVNFDNGTNVATPMLQTEGWIDSAYTGWATKSATLWNGNVLTGAEGINPNMPANIPPYVPDDPSTTSVSELVNTAHMLIEPATPKSSSSYPGDDTERQKFVSNASLVFTVGTDGAVKVFKYKVNNSSGAYVRRTATGVERVDRVQLNLPTGLIVGNQAALAKFKDKRRGKMIDVVDLDVSTLKSLIENSSNDAQWTNGSTEFHPASDWNGVVYVENNDTTNGAVRLINGSSIPDHANVDGFTIATNVPMYVKGNYNSGSTVSSTGSPPAAAIAADAVTVLSNAWSDANSDAAIGSRIATPTGIRAAFITGLVPSKSSTYSGGLENLPRLLEKWTNVTFGYRGSLIVLYESTLATEAWGTSGVYDAAVRDWGYMEMSPPGVIPVRSYRRIGFRQLSAPEFQAALSAL